MVVSLRFRVAETQTVLYLHLNKLRLATWTGSFDANHFDRLGSIILNGARREVSYINCIYDY